MIGPAAHKCSDDLTCQRDATFSYDPSNIKSCYKWPLCVSKVLIEVFMEICYHCFKAVKSPAGVSVFQILLL